MKPCAFRYARPSSVDEALALLAAAGGDAKVLAGGQSLVPMMNFRLTRSSLLIDINRIPELAFVTEREDDILIGATTRHHTLETSPLIAAHFPVLTAGMAHVAHLAIRNRGTIGGSLSHADPAAELPMLARLLDAKITIASTAGTRTAAAADFFVGALTSDLAEDELVTQISLPKLAPGTGWGFEEVARRSGDYALAAASAAIRMSGGLIAEARIALMGVADTPIRVPEAEAVLLGSRLEETALEEAIAAVRGAIEPNSDLHASSQYRKHLAGVLTRRAILAARARAAEVMQ